MATDNKETAKSITSLSELIKKQKSAMRDADLTNDINELSAYIENTTEKIRENTVRKKISDNMSKRWNTATNPRTYFRAVLPKMFKTWHQNMDLKDQMQDAERKRQALMEAERIKAVSNLKNELKELIDNDKELTKVFKEYGEQAAMEAALAREENKALKQAEAEFIKGMSTIEDRLQNLDKDAQAEWAKRKGIQLVKIVDDDPTVEELQKIKAEISEQIENDAKKYDEEHKERTKNIKKQQREKAELIEEKRWWKKYFGKSNVKAPDQESGGGWLDSLISGGIAGLLGAVIPFLIKAGLIAGIAYAFEKYINDPEFREKVNTIVGKILGTIWEFMKEHWIAVLAALAIAFPVTTIRLIGKAVVLLYDALWAIAERLFASLKAGKFGRGKVGKVVAGAAAVQAVEASSKFDGVRDKVEKDDAIKMLEREDFYKDLKPEEIKHHKELIDSGKFNDAEEYRNKLALSRGYRPTSVYEKISSSNPLDAKQFTKNTQADIAAIAAQVKNVDVPGAIPVEISVFGEESIGQFADLMLAYRKLNPPQPPVVVSSGGTSDDGKGKVTPSIVSSARNKTAEAKQLSEEDRWKTIAKSSRNISVAGID